MKSQLVRLIVIPLVCALTTFAVAADPVRTTDKETQNQHLLILVDHSGSMASEMEKTRAGVKVLTSADRTRGQKIGLIHFQGCGSDFIWYPIKMAEGTGRDISDKVATLKADNGTDLAGAMTMALDVMAKANVCARLALFTDNIDSCTFRGDPKDLMKGVKAHCLEVNVITYAKGKDLEFLQSLAEESGGKLYEAQTEEEKRKALQSILDRGKKTGTPSTFEIKQGTKKEDTTKTPETKEQTQPKVLPATTGGKKPETKSQGGKP